MTPFLTFLIGITGLALIVYGLTVALRRLNDFPVWLGILAIVIVLIWGNLIGYYLPPGVSYLTNHR